MKKVSDGAPYVVGQNRSPAVSDLAFREDRAGTGKVRRAEAGEQLDRALHVRTRFFLSALPDERVGKTPAIASDHLLAADRLGQCQCLASERFRANPVSPEERQFSQIADACSNAFGKVAGSGNPQRLTGVAFRGDIIAGEPFGISEVIQAYDDIHALAIQCAPPLY